jgi:hypothetical protein
VLSLTVLLTVDQAESAEFSLHAGHDLFSINAAGFLLASGERVFDLLVSFAGQMLMDGFDFPGLV